MFACSQVVKPTVNIRHYRKVAILYDFISTRHTRYYIWWSDLLSVNLSS